jgi:hypothetical protein
MPTVKEVAEQVKFLMQHGRAEEKAVLVLPRVANRRKQKNPQKHFRKAMDDGHASRFYAVWDKWLEAAGNKTVAIEIMLHTLEGISDEQIRAAANEQADDDYMMGRESLGDA